MSGTNLPANPLAAIIAQAARLPAETGATAQYKQRFASAGSATVVLLDCSGSMAESAGTQRRIDVLRAALDYALSGGETLVAFSSHPTEISSPAALPQPSGGTALHLALAHIQGRTPRQTLVISDGRPNDEQAALDEAARLSGQIDVIYCGPDDDAQAIAFMRRLATVGGGRVIIHDVAKHAAARAQIGASVRALLPGGRS